MNMIENIVKRIEEKYSGYQIGETAKSQIRDIIRLEIEYVASQLDEAITIPIEIGDTVLGGKFKNKPIVVKSIDKNEKGDITINGKPLLKYRLVNESNDNLEMMKLISKAMKAFPGSPKQKKIKQELNKLRVKNGLEPLPEGALDEKSGDVYNPPRGKQVVFTPKRDAELENEFFDLITTAYAEIGGHAKVKSPKDVFADPDWNFWSGIDIHGSQDFDVILFGKKTKYGVKYAGVGHDGTKDAKRTYLKSRGTDLKKMGYYAEVSGKVAEILIKHYDVPVVTNQAEVENVLGKPVEWRGESKNASLPGNGWYVRSIGGAKHEKILIGRPKGIKEDVIPGGLTDKMTLRDIANHHGVDFDTMKELAKGGVKVEMEHTSDKNIAYEIAKDHLYEDPEYYKKLSTIEERIEKVGEKWVVYPSKGGKRLGTHDTKEKALAQLKAIEVSKSKNEVVLDELSDSAKYYRDNPQARKKKAETDKKINKRPEQVKKRVESNKKRSDAKKRGQDVRGKDYDHATNRFEKTATNRGRAGEGGRKKTNEGLLSEIPMADLKQIDHFADKTMSPEDIVITDKHFFDRLNDPRNGKDISQAELVGFFKRLSKHKGEFLDFLKKYNSVLTTDKRTDINIPFMRRVNKQIVAKTIMRNKNYRTSDKRLEF